MQKNVRKGLIIASTIFLLLVVSFLIYSSKIKKPTQNEYLGVKTYPKAEFVQTVSDPNNVELVKTTLTTNDSVPDVSNWYLKNYLDSGWQLDIPPADSQSGDVQFIRLVKNKGQYADEYLGVSLIKGSDGKTQIILEKSTQAMQAENEEENEEN